MVKKGCENLVRHIKNVNKFGVPVVVALNKFSKDTQAEIDLVISIAKENGAFDAVLCENWEKGGEGGVALAEAVVRASNESNQFKFLYDLNLSIEDKIRTIAREIYGAKDIQISEAAQKRIDTFKAQVHILSFLKFCKLFKNLNFYTLKGFNDLPVCMAKTQYSFTDNPDIKGAPEGFILPIIDIRASIGAGFIYPLVGAVI